MPAAFNSSFIGNSLITSRGSFSDRRTAMPTPSPIKAEPVIVRRAARNPRRLWSVRPVGHRDHVAELQVKPDGHYFVWSASPLAGILQV
jgi:hypothetical protein